MYSREKWEYGLPSPVTQNFINFFCCGDTLQEQYHTVKTTNVEDTDEGMLYHMFCDKCELVILKLLFNMSSIFSFCIETIKLESETRHFQLASVGL